ncbi:uncharacterized protein J3R85_021167 [Psidium guajava]|nr:uncharacterized protein J3R85_021167 [Psidium guajava]
MDGRSVKGISDLISDRSSRSDRTLSSALDLTTVTMTCELTYRFLPRPTELWGELFLIAVYESACSPFPASMCLQGRSSSSACLGLGSSVPFCSKCSEPSLKSS